MKKFAVVLMVLATMLFASKVMAEALTAQACKDKATEAAKLLAAEGDAAIAKIKDPAGAFRFADGQGYIWIHDNNNVMIMHPIKDSMDGTPIADFKDVNGKYFFVDMTEIAMEKGAGWVAYMWPKPDSTESSPKVSYVVKAENGGKTYIAGSGIYDVTEADIKKQFPSDPIAE